MLLSPDLFSLSAFAMSAVRDLEGSSVNKDIINNIRYAGDSALIVHPVSRLKEIKLWLKVKSSISFNV